jgi:hypothetical protein
LDNSVYPTCIFFLSFLSLLFKKERKKKILCYVVD